MKRFLMTLCLLLVFAHVAHAEEKVVPLKHGMTLWGILGNEGCTAKERVPLWPQVAKDSGLDPARHRKWPADKTTIVIKRDCRGQILVDKQAGVVTSLKDQLQKANDTITQLTRERDEARARAARFPWNKTIFGFILVLVAGVVIGRWFLFRTSTTSPVPVLTTKLEYVHNDTTFTFRPTGGVEAICSECRERVMIAGPEDMQRHVTGPSHPLSRVKEVHDPRFTDSGESDFPDESPTRRV